MTRFRACHQDQRFPNMNTKQRAREIMRIHGLDSSMFLNPDQIREQIDLSGEENMFVRLLEREMEKRHSYEFLMICNIIRENLKLQLRLNE